MNGEKVEKAVGLKLRPLYCGRLILPGGKKGEIVVTIGDVVKMPLATAERLVAQRKKMLGKLELDLEIVEV